MVRIFGQVTLPDAGFSDLADYAEAIAVSLGALLGVVLAISLCFMITRKVIREVTTIYSRRN